MLDTAWCESLARALPPAAFLTAPEDTRPYECDGLSAYRRTPAEVALRENEAQVVAILKACHAARIPVIARGAGTGLSGGALPSEEALLLSLAKFTRILDIDVATRTAVVQPGVRNAAISQAAEPYGLYYAPDPSSQIACTIGGNVAENSGGVHCLKYGLTVHNVRRIRVALITGDVVEVGGEGLDGAGYDLLALMTGSEGLLGVITEVAVKLLPDPQRAQCALAAFATIPRRALAQVLTRIGELSAEYGLGVANVFHAGDGNLHPLILFDANRPGELHRAEEFGARILELCVEVGGTITGEHGVGIEKIDQMCVQFSSAELTRFHGVKRAFDEHGLLNPGKAVPSLHRCAEFGAMRVSGGKLPHPELPRF